MTVIIFTPRSQKSRDDFAQFLNEYYLEKMRRRDEARRNCPDACLENCYLNCEKEDCPSYRTYER